MQVSGKVEKMKKYKQNEDVFQKNIHKTKVIYTLPPACGQTSLRFMKDMTVNNELNTNVIGRS